MTDKGAFQNLKMSAAAWGPRANQSGGDVKTASGVEEI
jgi:hypothetical protein